MHSHMKNSEALGSVVLLLGWDTGLPRLTSEFSPEGIQYFGDGGHCHTITTCGDPRRPWSLHRETLPLSLLQKETASTKEGPNFQELTRVSFTKAGIKTSRGTDTRRSTRSTAALPLGLCWTVTAVLLGAFPH